MDNKMHGVGKFSWPDGRVYQGGYFHDKKQGFGTFYWYFFSILFFRPNGIVKKGQWSNGELVAEA